MEKKEDSSQTESKSTDFGYYFKICIDTVSDLCSFFKVMLQQLKVNFRMFFKMSHKST